MGCCESRDPAELTHAANKRKAVSYPGVSEQKEVDVVVSFPGTFQNEWNNMVGAVELLKVANPKKHFFSTSCVFLPEGDPNYGVHVPNMIDKGRSHECYCMKLYGRVMPWGCKWFAIWKENLELALSRNQAPMVVYKQGQVGMSDGYDWENLPLPLPFCGQGLGLSQVAEVAYLKKLLGPEGTFDKQDVMELYADNWSHADTYLKQLFHKDSGAHLLAKCIEKSEPARQGLRSLVLPDACFGDDGGLALAHVLHTLAELTDLEIGHSSFGDEASHKIADNIRHCRNLQELSIMKNHFGEAAGIMLAEALPSLTELKKLNLAANDLGDTAGSTIIAALAPPCNNLHFLSLEGNELAGNFVKELANVAPHWTKLEKLFLGGNSLGEFTKELSAALPNLTGIKYLELNDNQLSHDIVDQLPKLSTLETLDISNNPLGPLAGTKLAEALPHCPNLKVLHVASAGLGSVGGGELAFALMHCHLTYLRANDNDFGDGAGFHFADAMRKAEHLEVMLLANNNMGDASAKKFHGNLDMVKKIERLGLDGNCISADWVDELKHAWHEHKLPDGGLEPLTAIGSPRRNSKNKGL